MFRSPFLTVQQVRTALNVTHQGARNLLLRATDDYGWTAPIGTVGRGGRAVWVAAKVLDVIDAPLSYETEGVKAIP